MWKSIKLAAAGCAVALSTLPAVSIAGTVELIARARVDEIQVRNDGLTGNCMIRLNKIPTTASCGITRFVTLDCAGDVVDSKAASKAMLDTATLAKVTGATVWVAVEDGVHPSGYCLARAIYFIE